MSMSRREEEGFGCLMLILLGFLVACGIGSCCAESIQKQRDHEYRMEQLRLEHEKGRK